MVIINKVKIFILLIVLTILSLCTISYAYQNRVYDYKDALTQNEEYILNSLAMEISNQFEIECVVFTDYYRIGNSIGVQHAIDFYESKFTEDTDGLIFYANTDTDTCYASAHGDVAKMLNKSDKKELNDLGKQYSLKGGCCVTLVQMMNVTQDKLVDARRPLFNLGLDFPPSWYILGSLMISLSITVMFLLKIFKTYKHIPKTSDLEKYSSVVLDLSEYQDLFINMYTRVLSKSNRK